MINNKEHYTKHINMNFKPLFSSPPPLLTKDSQQNSIQGGQAQLKSQLMLLAFTHTKNFSTQIYCVSLQTVQNLQSSTIFPESLINSIWKHQPNSGKVIKKHSAECFLKKHPVTIFQEVIRSKQLSLGKFAWYWNFYKHREKEENGPKA